MTEWTQITLKVSVFDKAGNESNEVIFPFTFETGVRSPYSYNPPAPSIKGISKGWDMFISTSMIQHGRETEMEGEGNK